MGLPRRKSFVMITEGMSFNPDEPVKSQKYPLSFDGQGLA